MQEWQEISRKEIFKKYGRGIDEVIFKTPDNVERDFYVKIEGDSICALALTEKNEVILAKQFRPGPQKILLELPGGGLEKGEAPEVAIARELLEETGYAGDVTYIGPALADGYSPRIRHTGVVTNCKKFAEQDLEDGEFVEVVLMPLDEFREHLRGGQLTDIETGYRGLDYLGLL